MTDPARTGGSYYAEKLSGTRLQRCYDIAPPRVQQYLAAELAHVLQSLDSGMCVLELGCGYGRVLGAIAQEVSLAIGNDISQESLRFAREFLSGTDNIRLICANAICLGLRSASVDVVVCIQNGISAFKIEPEILIRESLRVARPGGRLIFSSYSERFWQHRLEWFVRQSAEGLLGEIDWDKTRDGTIVCRDGFHATTVGTEEFSALATRMGVRCHIEEVDASSLFCTYEVPPAIVESGD